MKKDLTEADLLDMLVAELNAKSFCILRNHQVGRALALASDLDPVFAATPFCKGNFYGRRTKRFGSLLKRSPHVAPLVLDPLILAAVERILGPGCDRIQLNLAQAIEIHPGEVRQFPHRDQDMWRGTLGETEYLVNVMWPFTEYSRDNGATLIWPGSHGARALDREPPAEPGVPIELAPGSALLFLGSTLHGAGGNRSEGIRRGCIVSYCLGWLKPYENQWLAYPPEVARHFSPELAALVGYRQHRPNLGNYEGRCPSILLGAEVPAHLGAIDALRPDQAATVAEFVAGQQQRGG